MLGNQSCKGCSDGRVYYGGPKSPVISALVQFSTIGDSASRRQKTSGSFGLCADCIAALIDGRMPKNMRAAVKNAYEALEGKL